jgi:hypothetical protein
MPRIGFFLVRMLWTIRPLGQAHGPIVFTAWPTAAQELVGSESLFLILNSIIHTYTCIGLDC